MQLKYFLFLFAIAVNNCIWAQKKIGLIPLYDTNNKTQFIQVSEKYKATVLWFFSPDCPLCQQYTLELKKLQKQFGKQVNWYAISVGKTAPNQLKTFIQTYGLNMVYLTDKHKNLVQELKAKITPEVFVFNSQFKLTYSGRIDNWAYAPGKTRPHTSIHDLAIQLSKLLKDQNIPYTSKTAIGCYIE